MGKRLFDVKQEIKKQNQIKKVTQKNREYLTIAIIDGIGYLGIIIGLCLL